MNRDSLFVENASITFQQEYPGRQFLLRLYAPRIAERTRAGHFVHVTCDPLRPLRRPLSILRASPKEGWIELLYRVVGEGTALLSQRSAGETVNLLGPIGQPFQIDTTPGARPLLIGGGIGMPPMIALADQLRHIDGVEPFVAIGSEQPFPFTPARSPRRLPGIDAAVDAAMPLLEEWEIDSRLATRNGIPGCLDGWVTDLAEQWLLGLDTTARQQVHIYACGPHPMLEAVAALAHRHDLPCQVSLEAFMACGLGGCAGCTVAVREDDGQVAMKRVCVDGPVFDARRVFPGGIEVRHPAASGCAATA